MKKILLTCLSLAMLLITSCGKESCCLVQIDKTQFLTAEKSGIRWEASPAASAHSKDTINVYGNNYNTNLEEAFGFLLKVNGEGTYILKGNQGYYYNTVGRDVLVSNYKLDDTFDNKVKVVTYDKDAKFVEGTFQIKFIKTRDNPTGSYPDKIAFLNGKFKVALHK